MSESDIIAKLDAILVQLERMETRQIEVKKEVEEVQQPVVGSFASTDSPTTQE